MTLDAATRRVSRVQKACTREAYLLGWIASDMKVLAEKLAPVFRAAGEPAAEADRRGELPLFVRIVRAGAHFDRDFITLLVSDEEIRDLIEVPLRYSAPREWLSEIEVFEKHADADVRAAATRLMTRVRLTMLGL